MSKSKSLFLMLLIMPILSHCGGGAGKKTDFPQTYEARIISSSNLGLYFIGRNPAQKEVVTPYYYDFKAGVIYKGASLSASSAKIVSFDRLSGNITLLTTEDGVRTMRQFTPEVKNDPYSLNVLGTALNWDILANDPYDIEPIHGSNMFVATGVLSQKIWIFNQDFSLRETLAAEMFGKTHTNFFPTDSSQGWSDKSIRIINAGYSFSSPNVLLDSQSLLALSFSAENVLSFKSSTALLGHSPIALSEDSDKELRVLSLCPDGGALGCKSGVEVNIGSENSKLIPFEVNLKSGANALGLSDGSFLAQIYTPEGESLLVKTVMNGEQSTLTYEKVHTFSYNQPTAFISDSDGQLVFLGDQAQGSQNTLVVYSGGKKIAEVYISDIPIQGVLVDSLVKKEN